jgi:hypothetical protein
VDGVEAGGERLGREAGPAVVGGGEVLVEDGLAGAVAVQAGAFLGLDLEELQDAHGVAGGGHDPQVAFWRDEHEPGCSDIEHVDASVGEHREELDDVEVGHERVGQLHEGLGEGGFSGHCPSRHLDLDFDGSAVVGQGAWLQPHVMTPVVRRLRRR